MRLFFALWPDDSTRARLSVLQQGVKGRRTKAADLHITLAFLGKQPESVLPSLQKIVDELVLPQITLTIDHIDYFKRQRIAWAGMRQIPESLFALQKALCSALAETGIAFDQRKDFKPHITLARNAERPDTMHFEPFVWHARQFSLVHSAAGPTGVSYHVLASQYCRIPEGTAEDLREE
ncbi:MAG: RNA 2',3'-cyclic phosphodiesterase [Burkholderiaceae bacterium]